MTTPEKKDTTAPETIWLQVSDESENYSDEVDATGGTEYGVTWCADKINGKDVEYVRADLYRELEKLVGEYMRMPR